MGRAVGLAGRPRRVDLALAVRATGAVLARAVKTNRGRADGATATAATTSSFILGSRLPRYWKRRCKALPPCDTTALERAPRALGFGSILLRIGLSPSFRGLGRPLDFGGRFFLLLVLSGRKPGLFEHPEPLRSPSSRGFWCRVAWSS